MFTPPEGPSDISDDDDSTDPSGAGANSSPADSPDDDEVIEGIIDEDDRPEPDPRRRPPMEIQVTQIRPPTDEERNPFRSASDLLSDCLDQAESYGKMIGYASARQLVSVNNARIHSETRAAERAALKERQRSFDQWPPEVIERKDFVAEVAIVLHLSEMAADKLITTSQIVMEDLHSTFESLMDGKITMQHVIKITDNAASLPKGARPEFEEAVLPVAENSTVSKTDKKARKERERLHPDSIAERTKAAAANRSLAYDPGKDGMATLWLYLPAEQAMGIFNKCTDIGKSLQGPAEKRTLAQLRADVAADLLINGIIGESNGIRAEVLVTVPVMTLLGETDEAGYLEGYGPISPDVARDLTANAPGFWRVLTHPITKTVLDVGREWYKTNLGLSRYLQLRDETCRFPGCLCLARNSELDHVVEWQFGGSTSVLNMGHLCKTHHMMKTIGAMTVTQDADGVQTWTTASGRTVTTTPETLIDPRPLVPKAVVPPREIEGPLPF